MRGNQAAKDKAAIEKAVINDDVLELQRQMAKGVPPPAKAFQAL